MVIFRNEITREQFIRVDLDPRFSNYLYNELLSHNIIYWKVSLTESDFEESLNVFYNRPCRGLPAGYQLLSPERESEISRVANLILEANFIWNPTEEQVKRYEKSNCMHEIIHVKQQLKKLEGMVKKFENKISRQYAWIIVGYSKDEPFWIYDGNHRALATYIFSLLNEDFKFEALDNCICGISRDTRLPYFDQMLYK